MENAADALKMAGAVLIFVLALSIIIFAFGRVRQTADIIIDYRDRETSYIEGNYYYESTNSVRNVNLETIIPSVYRAYLEEYKIIFDGLNEPLYRFKNQNGDMEERYTLGEESFLGNENDKAIFIRAILYRDFDTSQEDFLKKFGGKIDFTNCSSLYEQLNGKNNITEYLGVYYEDDNPNVPELNKNKKRIITYKVQ